MPTKFKLLDNAISTERTFRKRPTWLQALPYFNYSRLSKAKSNIFGTFINAKKLC